MALQSSIQPGFRDAVRESQSVFRLAMHAMARPGHAQAITPGFKAPSPLSAPTAALLLALCDFETPVWLDPPLAENTGIAEFLRFHTGVRLVGSQADAVYAVVSDAAHMPPLDSFAQGTPEYPDRSATLILQVGELRTSGWRLEGPGILDHTHFSAAPLPSDFVQQTRSNRSKLPCGVDVFFTTQIEIAALPRSVSVTEAG